MRTLTGHYRDESGLLTQGTALVDGKWPGITDPESGELLSVNVEVESYGTSTVLTNGIWEFLVDEDSLLALTE